MSKRRSRGAMARDLSALAACWLLGIDPLDPKEGWAGLRAHLDEIDAPAHESWLEHVDRIREEDAFFCQGEQDQP